MKKTASISAVRMTAMVLIIMCHIFQFYENELSHWFNVGVQIFFIISGYLYGSKEIKNPIRFIVNNFRKILIPYYIFIFFILVLYGIFARNNLSISAIYKALLCVGTIKGLGHLWFVGYILFCYFITPYLYWLKREMEGKPYILTIVVYAFILFLYQLIGVSISSYFKPDRVSCYIIGFFMADLARKNNNKSIGVLKYIFIPGVIIINIGRIYILHYATYVPEKAVVFYVHYSHLLLGMMLYVVLKRIFRKIQYNKILIFSDRYSYYIYIVHLLFIISPFTLLTVTPYFMLNIILCFVGILISSLFLEYLSRTISNRFI